MFTPNYYPNLQTPYFNPQMSFTQTQPQMQQNQDMNFQNNNDNGIIWVQGEAAAKAYPVLRNNTVVLWDSENQTIYIKSTDNSGMPSMRILDWTERKEQQKNSIENFQINSDEFVTRKEFDDVVKRLNNISNKLGSNKQKPNNNINKEENENGKPIV